MADRTLRDWTLEETLFVRDHMYTETVRYLAYKLGRHECDVYLEAARLMLGNAPRGKRLYWCPVCCNFRTTINNKGMCPVCNAKNNLQNLEVRMAGLLDTAPLEVRDLYESWETKRRTVKEEAKPLLEDFSGNAIEYTAALEAWEYKKVFRKMKASQKRIERIRKHIADSA